MKGRNDQPSRIGHWPLVIAATLLLALSAAPATTASADSGRDTKKSDSTKADLPLGSMYNVVDQIGARKLWRDGITGEGVNIALVDTGFAPVQDLMDSGRILTAVDLSAEAGVPEATYVDNYGHGTHMAGIIAGRSPATDVDPAKSAKNPEWFLGVAPDAQIVSVKVADNAGGADISQVIAGVDWAVDHADEFDIKVINLSYASGSALPYDTDPLTFALERAWRAGIVVVVAAGNDGRKSNVLASPALDPYVIAVGAVEAKKDGSFKVPSWASSGDGVRNPDLAAPGAHIDSLRAPLSRVDLEHPEGYVDEVLFRGSGSSQAAAVVSGAVALLLDADPNLSPDQVKALLTSNTRRASPDRANLSGSGVVQVDKAVAADKAAAGNLPPSTQSWAPSTGTGLLEAARGPLHMVMDGVDGELGTVLEGENTVIGPWTGAVLNADLARVDSPRWVDDDWMGVRWTSEGWNGVRWTGVRWTGAPWDGVRWTGVRWTDLAWDGANWDGVRWTGGTWTGVRWTGGNWDGVRWTGVRWTADEWQGASWTGVRWTGVRWTDDQWSAAIWDGVRWTGVRWTGERWDGVRWTGVRWTDVTWDGVRWTGVRWTGVRWTGVRWTVGSWAGLAWSDGAWE